jgi:predicted Zn finger-like uncharacterized protein
MRIVCPVCTATYEVRDALLAPGRTVRCTRCGEEWAAVPAAAPPPPLSTVAEPEEPPFADVESDPLAPLPSGPTAMDRLASHPAALPLGNAGLRAAWAASIVVLVLLGLGFVTWRGDLMRAWPPSTRLYDAIGLAPER